MTELRKQKADLERELDVQSTETQKQVQKLSVPVIRHRSFGMDKLKSTDMQKNILPSLMSGLHCTYGL